MQRHTGAAGAADHWDLMVEDGPVLVTFQLDEPPWASARGRRSFDHRAVYLDYEGPIAGDRGVVAIEDRGEVEDEQGGPRDARWRAVILGERLRGRLALDEREGAVEVRVAP